MISWAFPTNNEGQIQGPNHAGIETFLNDPLSSLAKETCQNSCDAALDGASGPVEIHFALDLIDASEVPGIEQLRKSIEACRHFWRNNKKGKALFTRALAVANASKIPVLRVSDYNTEGLT